MNEIYRKILEKSLKSEQGSGLVLLADGDVETITNEREKIGSFTVPSEIFPKNFQLHKLANGE